MKSREVHRERSTGTMAGSGFRKLEKPVNEAKFRLMQLVEVKA